MNAQPVAIAVFFATLMLTFGTAIYARMKASKGSTEEDLAGRSLNKWLIGSQRGHDGQQRLHRHCRSRIRLYWRRAMAAFAAWLADRRSHLLDLFPGQGEQTCTGSECHDPL